MALVSKQFLRFRIWLLSALCLPLVIEKLQLMVLQSDILRFGNINFEWRPNEKREIAFRVLEVMGELGYYTGTAELDPSEAHKAVILYQTKKQIKPANGRFGRQTLLQLFNDFLHLE